MIYYFIGVLLITAFNLYTDPAHKNGIKMMRAFKAGLMWPWLPIIVGYLYVTDAFKEKKNVKSR